MVTTLIDITGQRFGRLVVLERCGTVHGQALWLCKCDCGNEARIRGSCLRRGESKSCGCLASELASSRLRTHGKSKTRLFKIWSCMKERCLKPYHKSYADYGGRGITICDKWTSNFEAFFQWAMSNGYSETLSIDRIDTNGNYEPSNCKWSNAMEQANNRRSSRKLYFDGQEKTISEWAATRGLHPDTLLRRLKNGWSTSDAILTPTGGIKYSECR